MIKNRTTSPELEEEIRKSIQENPSGIDPQLMEYAKSIFPNLQTAVLPKNYNELAQKEALDNNPLPDNYNELAQQEALDNNPLPDDYNELAQQEASEENFIPQLSETDKLKQRAQESLASQRGPIASLAANIRGKEFSLDEIAQEMQRLQAQDERVAQNKDKIAQENQRQLDAETEGRINRDANIRKMGLSQQYDPELLDYASTVFPSLKQMGLSSGIQIPLSPGEQIAPEEQMPQAVAQKPQPAPAQASQGAPSQSMSTGATPAAQPTPAAPSAEMPSQPSDIERMIQQASEEEDRAALWKQSARLRDAAMGAGSGTILKTDTSLYEDLEKKAQRPMKNYILKQELEDKKAKNDPNSAISRLMRKSLSDLNVDMTGFESVSYAQLEKIYPAYTQALYTKIAADAKKEENQIRRSEAANAKMEKLDQTKQKQLVDHINYSVNNLKKAYENYSKSQTTIDSISNILGGAKNKITPGTADVTMLYSFISSLDPASTVREGEIALSKSAMSLWGRIKQGTLQLGGGDLLDSDTRKSIEEIMKVVQAAREKQFAKQKANLIQAGVGKGLDKDMLNSYIYPEIDASSALAKSKKAEVSEKENVQFSKQYKPGSVITLKDGNKYIIQEDGVTGVKK